MFVSLPSRRKPHVRWATPVLLVLLSAAFCWSLTLGDAAQGHLLTRWGALTGGMVAPEVWLASLQSGTVLRLFTALFLHADWAHLVGNLVFLLIFGLPSERAMGPWRFLLLFLVGGAVANVAAVLSIGTPDRVIIGASGAVSAVIGAYLALFPTAKLGVVLPLGLFLEFVKAPASLLIGIWALLQVVFAYTGPTFGTVAWWAHIAGFLFGVVFALFVRAAIARRMRKRQGY
ncbi:membrane associated rhomboid family serine protease [Pseudoxanthomonas japonensis]|uniref:rhomboid family intramembrane serine protease n=1 Tax=Pseudoxanthomonas TaxID=83618 RepID=UPI00078510B7|nr:MULTISPECIES: rhomboid family intramembrane serine protease [Pseudoxanthomonas]MBA3930285.1 rhomboid family intramembrane serine protease [Xanthomonas sp.]MBL8257911.1 rhomboid family intramembrane serine protease [Pseudoxanthomonas mexicana]MDR7068497.1 membrane associated rhomboid family serine protease [Pseudoxanthomonas japonensis]